jgi:threonyl-tRNA synthetase
LVCSGVSQTDFKDLETIFSKVTKEKQVFERLVVSKQEALELFQYNAFK